MKDQNTAKLAVPGSRIGEYGFHQPAVGRLSAMMRILRKIRRNFRDNSLVWTLIKMFGLIGWPIYYRRTYRLYRVDLSRMNTPASADVSFAFRFLKPDDIEYVNQIYHLEEWLEGRMESVFKSGGICLVALDGSTVAGFNLVSFRNMNLPVVQYSRALRSNQAFSVQISVANRYRCRGLGTALRLEIFKALRLRGTRYLYGGTDIHNRANLALCRKVGFKAIADVRYTKLFRHEETLLHRVRT